MSDTSHLKCPRCGKELPPSAPEGLCPACLGALNFATETNVTGADVKEALPPMTPAELAPHFPQLEILECLGRGGMGVVYKAKQKSLNRMVALKLLAPERVQDAKFAERFAREAQALARLNHPSIVTIHDFGQAGGFYFLLMEFVDGVNLRQLLHSRKLQPAEALAIVPPICEALQFAHEHGIVHRDIKPENLLLAKDGRVKIADFGIAKMLGASGSAFSLSSGGEGRGEEVPGDSATQQTTMGTPQYMAPEQRAQPQAADHRADIYSLGVVLYELLTGELPTDKLQPPSRKVQIDVRLDEIVMRALEKTPELRYQTAGEFKTQVETIRTPAEPSASNPGLVVRCRSCRHERAAESVFGIQWSASHRESRMFIWCPRCHCPRIGEVVMGTLPTPAAEAPGKPGGLGVMLAMLVTVFYTLVLAIGIMGAMRVGVLETLIVFAVLGAVAWSFRPRNWAVQSRALSWLAFVVSLPAIIFSAFFIIQRFRETGGWHPNSAEAVLVPLIGLGAVLLPWAQSRLRRASREAASATSTGGQKGGARLLWVVGALLIALILVGAAVFITNANRVKYAQVEAAREAAERKQEESRRWATTVHQLTGPPYIAQLPYGGTVELLAVRLHPGNTNQPWWRPDGSPSPYGPDITIEGANDLSGGVLGLVRVKWPKAPEGKETSGFSMNGGRFALKDGLRLPLEEYSVIHFENVVARGDEATLSLSVGVRDEWETLVTMKPGRAKVKEWEFSTTANGNLKLSAKQLAQQPGAEYRLVALDTAGKLHTPNSFRTTTTKGSLASEYEAVFDGAAGSRKGLRPDAVQEVYWQQRPLDSIEFSRVSVKPGHLTKLSVREFADNELATSSAVNVQRGLSKSIAFLTVTNHSGAINLMSSTPHLPGAVIQPVIRFEDGSVEAGSFASFSTKRTEGPEFNSISLTWQPFPALAPELELAALAQIRERWVSNDLVLTPGQSTRVFTLTNAEGMQIYGEVDFKRVTHREDGAKLSFGKAKGFPGFVSALFYSSIVPEGCQLVVRGQFPKSLKGEAASNLSWTRFGSNGGLTWFLRGGGKNAGGRTVDSEGQNEISQLTGEAARQMNQLVSRGPLEVRLGQSIQAFSVTNSAGEVFSGSFELVGRKP